MRKVVLCCSYMHMKPLRWPTSSPQYCHKTDFRLLAKQIQLERIWFYLITYLISCLKIKRTKRAFCHRLGSSSTELIRSDYNMRKGVRLRAGLPAIWSQTWPSSVQTKASFCPANACVFKTPTQRRQTLLQRHHPLTQAEWHFSWLADGLLCKVRASLAREWADGMFGVKVTPESMQRNTHWTINFKKHAYVYVVRLLAVVAWKNGVRSQDEPLKRSKRRFLWADWDFSHNGVLLFSGPLKRRHFCLHWWRRSPHYPHTPESSSRHAA